MCLKSLCKLTISSGNKNILKSQQLLVKKCGNPVYDHCAMNGHNSMCSFFMNGQSFYALAESVGMERWNPYGSLTHAVYEF